MGNRKQKHGYDPDMVNALRGVPLPPKIKCTRCERHLVPTSFSAKQLGDARYAIKNQGVHARYAIKCMNCTGRLIVEIQCIMCDKYKGIEDFAKSQRTKPDQAKCFACIEEQLEQAPVAEEAYEDPRNAYVTEDSSHGKYPDYFGDSTNPSHASDHYEIDDGNDGGVSLANAMNDLAISRATASSANTGTLIDSDYTSTSFNNGGPVYTLGGDGWALAGAQSWRTKSSGPSENSGLHPNNYDDPSSQKSFSTNVTERSNMQTKNGWAKIKAYKPEKPEKIEEEEEWNSESEEETSGPGVDDDDNDDEDVEI